MKTTLTALAFVLAASLLLPPPAAAQNYEEMIQQNKDYDPSKPRNPQRDNELNSKSLYGETEGGLANDYGVDQDTAGGPDEDDAEMSYDEKALPGGGPKDLYSYIGEDRDNSEAGMTDKRQRANKKAHEEALKTQKKQLKKLQANTDRLIREQKERAWKLANPGQEYPGGGGEDGTAEPDADDDSADAGDDAGDTGDGSDTADAGGGDAGSPDEKDAGDTADAGGGDAGDEGGAEGGGDDGTEQADAGAADNVTVTNVQ